MNKNEKLQQIFRDAFDVEELTDEMSIDTVEGWDSMAHVALIMTLQKEFNLSISPEQAIELTNMRSIKELLGDGDI